MAGLDKHKKLVCHWGPTQNSMMSRKVTDDLTAQAFTSHSPLYHTYCTQGKGPSGPLSKAIYLTDMPGWGQYMGKHSDA